MRPPARRLIGPAFAAVRGSAEATRLIDALCSTATRFIAVGFPIPTARGPRRAPVDVSRITNKRVRALIVRDALRACLAVSERELDGIDKSLARSRNSTAEAHA